MELTKPTRSDNHAPHFYPACNWLRKNFDDNGSTGAPILILSGARDSWGDGEACPIISDWLNGTEPGIASLVMYPDVHHGFDKRGSWTGYAPYAKDQTATLQWDAEAAHDSRRRAVAFLRQVFGL